MLKKIIFILSPKQIKGIVLISLLLFLGMILEAFGLGVLLPIISFILEPETLINNSKQFLSPELQNSLLNLNQRKYLPLILLSIFVGVYFFKFLYLAFLTYKQNNFIAKLNNEFCLRLVSKYLRSNYKFFINNNSSLLLKNVQIETHNVNVYFNCLIVIFIEIGLITAIITTLILIEPFAAISVFFFLGGLALVFYRFTKNRLQNLGKIKQKIDADISKRLIEAFEGIKEIKILMKESFILESLKNSYNSQAKIISNHQTIVQLPRYYLEFISALGISFFVIILLLNNSDTTKIISILALFVAATFRILPSLNKIIYSFQNLKYYRSSLDLIYNEFKDEMVSDDKDDKRLKLTQKISINNLMFNYSDKKDLFKNLNFEIIKGETIGIIGESGIGKSSLVNLIIGLFDPVKGKIKVDNKDLSYNKKAWLKNIGYVSQDIFLFDDTILNNIAFGSEKKDIDLKKINNIIKITSLDNYIESLPLKLNTLVGEKGVKISGGQKQRLGIARALYTDPEILIFDEATSALDEITEKKLLESIYSFKKTKTIILISHDIDILDKCDKILDLNNFGT